MFKGMRAFSRVCLCNVEREAPDPEPDTAKWEDNNLFLSECSAVAPLSKNVVEVKENKETFTSQV